MNRPLCKIRSWQRLSTTNVRFIKGADLHHIEPVEEVSNILQEMILRHELGLRADGFQRRICLLAHLGVHGVQTHRSAEHRAVVGIRRQAVALVTPHVARLMDPVDPEPSLGKEAGLALQGVSTQIAGIVVNDHSRGLGEATRQHIECRARAFVPLHDGEAPADAVRTEAREDAGRERPIPAGELVARLASESTHRNRNDRWDHQTSKRVATSAYVFIESHLESCTDAFNDITDGNIQWGSDSNKCLYGFPAALGWDAATGLGTINFEPFVACAKRYQDEVRGNSSDSPPMPSTPTPSPSASVPRYASGVALLSVTAGLVGV